MNSRKPRRPGPSRAATGRPHRRTEVTPGTRQLPREIDDLASGRSDRLQTRRKPQERLSDGRAGGLIPGVANPDGRRVLDARVGRLRRAAEGGDEAELCRGLLELRHMALWRARQLTGFAALAEDVVGVEAARAQALSEAEAERRGTGTEPLPDAAVALWLRAEAALLDYHAQAQVEVAVVEGELQMRAKLPLFPPERCAEALSAMGRRAGGLARVIAEENAQRRHPRKSEDD
ncbi:MAG: hypothetical protein OEZ06_24950 [Myxococcales bacterium]|nr:hypothetical protein [Myxococcales bacterium]